MKCYLAGSLFNEANVAQRKLEGKMFRERFPKIELFNPIDQPFNENKQSLPTPNQIYLGDACAVNEADILIVDLSDQDPGCMCELGLAINSNTKYIIGINSDIRLASANKYDIPTISMNHFILGAILENGYLVSSFSEALDKLEELLSI